MFCYFTREQVNMTVKIKSRIPPQLGIRLFYIGLSNAPIAIFHNINLYKSYRKYGSNKYRTRFLNKVFISYIRETAQSPIRSLKGEMIQY